MQPDISTTEDEAEAEKVLSGKADFSFSIAYEVVPQFELQDPSSIKVTREVFDVPAEEIEAQAMRIAESARTYESKKGKAEDGDRVTMDFVGKIGGEPFEGGSGEDVNLVLGSGQFIPGFEDQLVGAKAGDEKSVTVTFPQDYSAAHLAGKDAVFDVKVKDVARPGKLELNDEVAKALGIESIERLRELIRGQIESQYGAVTRQKLKRQILDALDEMYQFEAPSNLVHAEFHNIWHHMEEDLARAGRSFADEGTTEEEAREEYENLAERRVRLGLVLARIGEEAKVEITEEEMQRALMETARQYPGQERQVFEYYTKNPDAMANFRAPLFEEKVIDHLIARISVTDRKVSKEELLAEEEEEKKPAGKKKAAGKRSASKAHSHDHHDHHHHDHSHHGHDHDHHDHAHHDHDHHGHDHHDHDHAPAESKPARKKPAAKKKSAGEGKAE
jgi:trigger factor